jgi:hypothetical protein
MLNRIRNNIVSQKSESVCFEQDTNARESSICVCPERTYSEKRILVNIIHSFHCLLDLSRVVLINAISIDPEEILSKTSDNFDYILKQWQHRVRQYSHSAIAFISSLHSRNTIGRLD